MTSFDEPAAFIARQCRRHGLRHFLFTSARVGEGTTTTVLGIARELQASYALRVLAVEVNPGSDGFGSVLGLERPPAEYPGRKPLSIQEIHSDIIGYSLLSINASSNSRPAEGNAVLWLEELLKRVENEFDVVLIDVPPVLDRKEVIASAHLVDGVILVVEAGRTRQEMLGHIRAIFAREELAFLGSILTKQEYAIPGWVYRLMFKA